MPPMGKFQAIPMKILKISLIFNINYHQTV